MRRCAILVLALGLLVGWGTSAAAQTPRKILVLGSAGFLNAAAVQAATGAAVVYDLGTVKQLKDVAVIVIANQAYASLPAAVQAGLEEYVAAGGALWLTGGAQAFGSGGYRQVPGLLPFQIRADSDWRSVPFRMPVTVQPGHPALQGVSFLSAGALNDMNPRPGATEILQTSGGGSYAYPLIAEIGVGAGRVLGVALDLNDFAGMPDRDRFVQNSLAYLLNASRLGR
jgi:hypothetical protein